MHGRSLTPLGDRMPGAWMPFERTTMAILPWLYPLLMLLNAVILIPDLTLGLPRMLGFVR